MRCSRPAEQAADLVQRVVLVATPVQGVLLDAAADLVDDLGAELDDVERVEHGDRVGQLVADRVGVATERVQGGLVIPAVNSSGCALSQAA